MFSAAVVGLGNIGLRYDYDETDASRVLTHSSAFYNHRHFDLVAGVDPSPAARKKFEDKFNKPTFATVVDLYGRMAPDVLAIGVPTPLHSSVFEEIIRHSPKAILCEKPIASTLVEGKKMCEIAQAAHCTLLVNYMRRFEPGVIELKKRIKKMELGDIYKGVLWYSKGILNNGSHFVDLLIFLLGNVKDIALLDPGRKHMPHDPEPDLKIKFGDVDIYFLAGREENFSVKELELMGTSGSINYFRGGEDIVLRKTCPHDLFPTYMVLEKEGMNISTDLRRYQLHVLDALYETLTTGAALNSDGQTALETMAVVEKIIMMTKEASHV
jgi:predicted dehydrogenase